MFNSETDLLFPPRIISALSSERGRVWQDLVASIEKADPQGLEQTAFILMMARMDSCCTCNSDSFRAMNGCTICARQALKRFRGSDEELVRAFENAMGEVVKFLHN
jgi:hypothetical protein